MGTKSFHKVAFSAQEILDEVGECETLQEFAHKFADAAELRSRDDSQAEFSLMAPGFAMGPAWTAGSQCCGKPVGCTNMSDQCSMTNHPWKQRNVKTSELSCLELQPSRPTVTPGAG